MVAASSLSPFVGCARSTPPHVRDRGAVREQQEDRGGRTTPHWRSTFHGAEMGFDVLGLDFEPPVSAFSVGGNRVPATPADGAYGLDSRALGQHQPGIRTSSRHTAGSNGSTLPHWNPTIATVTGTP